MSDAKAAQLEQAQANQSFVRELLARHQLPITTEIRRETMFGPLCAYWWIEEGPVCDHESCYAIIDEESWPVNDEDPSDAEYSAPWRG